MRALLFTIALLFSLPAFAADWGGYENARFGFFVEVPPDFEPQGEAANGDGQVFASTWGGLLRVYGGNVLDGTFETSINEAMGFAEEAGWSLSYERVTPTWASFSGTKSGRILYARAIALCGGTQFASFELEYPRAELEPMHSVVERLVRSLRPTGRGVTC